GTVLSVNPPSRLGEFRMQGNELVEFVEKPELHSAWINGGYFFFRRTLFDKRGTGLSDRTAAIANLEAQKVCVAALTDERDALSVTTAELQSVIKRLRIAVPEAEQHQSKQDNDLEALREEANSLRTRL